MNDSTSSGAPEVPADFMIPLMEDFFSSISMEQTVDLAVGEPDDDTLSKLKELVLDVANLCTGFIYKARFTSGDVETVVGKSVLKSFLDFLNMRPTTQPKSFDTFNKQLVKLVKEKLSYVLGPMDDQLAFYVSEMDRLDIMLPHAEILIEELLTERCIQHQQRKQNVAEDQLDVLNSQQTEELQPIGSDRGDSQTVEEKPTQRSRGSLRRYHHLWFEMLPVIPEEPELEEAEAEINEERGFIPEDQESDLKLVDEFISEELSAMNKEKELELKMVDEFISEELSAMNKEKELELKLVDEFISEELSVMNKVNYFISKKKESVEQ
ncbi:uncharacterized protein LOC118566307 [Fundulus heteroclitus]|uniref:uncharacterized protein LOC118566307 n=1 Tax=Fundulus heteroclitus TaxID=8078 RepID=UPI00165C9651|nr:uncharacterized protein LOC118566307 [Fundulus heteroclitus]